MAAESRKRKDRMDQPLERGRSLRPSVDSEQFGAWSEKVARHIGSWAFIMWMTVAIIIWVLINVLAPSDLRPDSYPFIFLTLLLSLQASYAVPLILLAQNRQADRDRVQFAEDRARTERLLADNDYVARELAGLRQALGEAATRDFVRSELRDMLEEIMTRLDRIESSDSKGRHGSETED